MKKLIAATGLAAICFSQNHTFAQSKASGLQMLREAQENLQEKINEYIKDKKEVDVFLVIKDSGREEYIPLYSGFASELEPLEKMMLSGGIFEYSSSLDKNSQLPVVGIKKAYRNASITAVYSNGNSEPLKMLLGARELAKLATSLKYGSLYR